MHKWLMCGGTVNELSSELKFFFVYFRIICLFPSIHLLFNKPAPFQSVFGQDVFAQPLLAHVSFTTRAGPPVI